MHEEGKGKSTVKSVERALQILELLTNRNWAVSINEMAGELDIPRATAFRIVKTLEQWGYVYNSSGRGDYVLSTRVISLGSQLDRLTSMRQAANPFMFELAKLTGQTVQLGVLFEYEVMYVDQIVASSQLTVVVPSEKPFPINLSAGGKVLAAYLSSTRQVELLENSELPERTPKTIVKPSELRDELERVRVRGYAVDNEEFARGVRCIAAPVFNNTGECIFSLGITGHLSEITDERMEELIDAVGRTANRISGAFGHIRSVSVSGLPQVRFQV